MIMFCLSCRRAHHDKDMYSDDLCFSCLYGKSKFESKQNKELRKSLGIKRRANHKNEILTEDNAEGPVREIGPDAEQGQLKLF